MSFGRRHDPRLQVPTAARRKGRARSAVHSLASGLDYPGVGPEHCFLKTTAAPPMAPPTTMKPWTRSMPVAPGGDIPALESAHAVAYAMKIAPPCRARPILVNLSGTRRQGTSTTSPTPSATATPNNPRTGGPR
jgi:tryptophan synthase beta subunit